MIAAGRDTNPARPQKGHFFHAIAAKMNSLVPSDGYPGEDPCDKSVAACSSSNIKVKGSADGTKLAPLRKAPS